MLSRIRSQQSRRHFLKGAGLAGFTTVLPSSIASLFSTPSQATLYTERAATRPQSGVFELLPLGAVRPRGWLKAQLHHQASGLSGHLDETWPSVGPDSGWLGGSGESGERGPYFLDGLIPLAYLLDEPRLKAKAQKFIEWTLRSQTADGMFGPASNVDWWPRMVMLKALTQYHEVTGDPTVLAFMSLYLKYLAAALPARPLSAYAKFRWQEQVLTILWLYDRTADPALLKLVTLLRAQGYDWIGQYEDFQYKDRMTLAHIAAMAKFPATQDAKMAAHGVNNAQAIKTGAMWWRVSGANTDRFAVSRMMETLDRYHGLPNGMFSCDEHFAGRNPSQGSELCSVVEYMYSLEQALAILGDAALGDRLEKLAFNALPGTMTDDMWAHQYDQQPNQVECSLHKEPWTTNGPESNLFGLDPNIGCCTANFSQGWPKFASSLFMKLGHEGIVAAAYAPCEARITLRGAEVHIVEETEYPFRENIRMMVRTSRPLTYPLLLRIPAWAEGAKIMVNGRTQGAVVVGTFARIEREWKHEDIVEIIFPMNPRAITGFNGSISLERGPLVFSHKIDQNWLELRDRSMTADWQVYPASRWNYALASNAATPEGGMIVSHNPMRDHVFAADNPPVEIHVRGRLLPEWVAEEGNAGPPPVSPVESSENEETIRLIPYAAAKLRITSFPTLSGQKTL